MTKLKIESAPAAEVASAGAEPPPFGRWVSDAARRTFDAEVKAQGRAFGSLLEARAVYDAQNSGRLEIMRPLFATAVAPAILGGVRVDVVVPASREPVLEDNEGVLICLHGGAFAWGAGDGALLEAVPIAAVSGMTVVAVDYRMAPEHGHPAAVEDVIAVYRALTTDRPARRVGVYGCSAGAILTAQVLARLQAEELERPGAVALMHAGGLELDGDLLALAPMMTGDAPAAGLTRFADMPYFAGADVSDPLVFPGEHSQVLARFPPTLLVTGTRDFSASSMSVMHRRMLAAGAEAEFILFDGLWHAFHMTADLPESRELYDRVSDFFQRRLS
jgi:monoterpene epsilon-lactone hydrolase